MPWMNAPEKVMPVSTAWVDLGPSFNRSVIIWQTRSGKPSPLTSCALQENSPPLADLTGAPDRSIVAGLTCVASNPGVLRIATGVTPSDLRLIGTGALAGGLICIVTGGGKAGT